jgi:hypothetical protein
VILREATAADWPQIGEFFLATPLQSGTSFVLDRRPDFGALPALRGSFRTFLVFQDHRLAGTVTALWRPAANGARIVTVGELIDLRVAPWARGGRAVFYLLNAAYDVFVAERVEWVFCLIGKHNRATSPLVSRSAGLPPLEPLEDFASVNFVAGRVPRFVAARGVTVRAAEESDAGLLADAWRESHAPERFVPPDSFTWPDPAGRHRAWLAFEPDGTPCGALVTWDGGSVRRVRVVRYRAADRPIRAAIAVAAVLGITNPLPAPGEVLGLWASRALAISRDDARTLRALLEAALSAAATAAQSVLQINLHGRDPLLRRLPPYPRSTYWSTLYGGPFDGSPLPAGSRAARYHADLARV